MFRSRVSVPLRDTPPPCIAKLLTHKALSITYTPRNQQMETIMTDRQRGCLVCLRSRQRVIQTVVLMGVWVFLSALSKLELTSRNVMKNYRVSEQRWLER